MHGDLRALLALTTECATAEQYEQARMEWLQRLIGFDLFYLGAAFPDVHLACATAGVDAPSVQSCEAKADRYWVDRVALNRGVMLRGGVAVDVDVLSARQRSAMALYDEIMSPLGVRMVAAAVFAIDGRARSCLYLGRTLARTFDRSALDVLRDALPILALGARLQALTTKRPVAPEPRRFSAREREIIDYVCLGLTNAEIATAIGTSPNTVKNQIASVLRKAEVANRTELVATLGRG